MGTPPQVFTTSEVMQLPIQANLPHPTNSPIGIVPEAAKKNPSTIECFFNIIPLLRGRNFRLLGWALFSETV